jgi:hypothetical protein
MSRWSLAAAASSAATLLTDDLTAQFGARLASLVAYGRWVEEAADGSPGLKPRGHDSGSRPDADTPLHTVALVTHLEFADLAACADRSERWARTGLVMPLLLTREEFVSALDAFPIEFGDIIERHVPLAGADPFAGVHVRPEDLRRACEVQARSHLIHLREGFLEAGGQPEEVGRLIRRSAVSFGSLLTNLARLEAADGATPDALARFAEVRLGVSAPLVRTILGSSHPLRSDEALQLYAPYHDASARIAAQIDRWKGSAGA